MWFYRGGETEGEVVPLEKLPLMGDEKGASSTKALQVVATVQIQESDTVCNDTVDEKPDEYYVGHVTHLRSKIVSLNIWGYKVLVAKYCILSLVKR